MSFTYNIIRGKNIGAFQNQLLYSMIKVNDAPANSSLEFDNLHFILLICRRHTYM